MKISLDLKKTAMQNAQFYFEKAKVFRKKAEGAEKAVAMYEKKYTELLLLHEQYEEKAKKEEADREKKLAAKELQKQEQKWFHKFRWFISSQGFLVVAGRDATTNEIVVKKHTDPNDIVLHTDIAGSPFTIIKTSDEINEIKNPDVAEAERLERTIKEAAIFCATFSRAWKLGLSSVDVFYVRPEQVSKEAKPGEYIQKGSFMIYGKKNYVRAGLQLAVCMTKFGVMASPVSAAESNAKSDIIIIEQGNDKTSDVAKKVQKLIGGDIDEIVKIVPAGGARIGRVIKIKK